MKTVCAFLLALMVAILGCHALELRLVNTLYNSRANCEVVCVEGSLVVTNTTQIGDDDDLSRATDRITSISSLQVFKQDVTDTSTNSDGKRRRLLASVSSQKSRLTRVSNGVKVNGRLEAGTATLRLEFVKQSDCLAEFFCQVEGVDSQGRTIVGTSHILQQQQRDNTGQGDAVPWTSGQDMQVFTLLQQMSTKLEVLRNSMTNLDDDLRRVEETTQHDIEALKSDLHSKTDRVEDKIQNLGKDLDTQTDRLEDKLEDIEKGQIKTLSHLEDKTESLITRLEDKLEPRISHKPNTEPCSDITADDVERIVKKEVISLNAKLSTIKDDLSLVRSNIADNFSLSFSKIEEKLDSWETKEHKVLYNLTQTSLTATCAESKDLASFVDGEFDSLKNNIQVKFDEISSRINLTATETHSLLNTQSSVRYVSFEGDLNSTLSDLLTPKHCYKGMSSSAPSTSSPYTVIQPNQANSFTLPILCDTFTDGGGWIVFQRRATGDVTFYRKWQEYKDGFGSLSGDFWLGNDIISALTKDGVFELRVDMMYNGKFVYAHYDSFSVGDENSNYVLRVSNYNGNAGDSFSQHNGMPFSTHDRDNDNWPNNCAVEFVGAWWYKSCHYSNLNGQWGSGNNKGLRWNTFTGANSVTYSEMKLRRLI